MKSNPLRSLVRGIVLALPVAVSQITAQTLNTSATATVQTNTPTALIDARIEKANALLDYILAPTNAAVLAIYPPDYIETLEGIASGTAAATNTMLDGPQPVSAQPLTPGDKANMHWLDAQFVMGSPSSEAERGTDEGQYTAVISYGFFMGNFEVTQYEYQLVMLNNPSWFTSTHGYPDNLNRPVESVSWMDASNYCYVLTQQAQTLGSIPAGWEYRLPTETEWEYSCRAMTYGQQGVQTAPPQLPFLVPWTDPVTGLTYTHYFMGNVASTGQGLAFIDYFNDSAHTFDAQGNDTTVGALGGRIGTESAYGHEQAYIDAQLDITNAIEFEAQDITTVPWSANNYTSANGDGSTGGHFVVVGSSPWFTSPWWFSSSVEVDSSLGNGVIYTPDLETYNTFTFGNAIHGGMANFNDNYEYNNQTGTVNVSSPTVTNVNMTTNVGSYAANRFGLSDMHGNVSEWCQDWYGAYPTTTTVDPQGPASGTSRVVRGGSWADHGVQLRSAARAAYDPSTVTNTIGFRIVLAPVIPDWKTAVSTQPSAKTYGILPTKTSNNLVVITHGWTLFDRNQSWIDVMSNSIVTNLAAASIPDWQVDGYYWEPNSSAENPDAALVNAIQEGIRLGNSVVDQGWAKVHFIAHSAGAQLIESATQIIKERSPSTVVQCTFLDPYVGKSFTGELTYGLDADWSDRYAAHGDWENLGSHRLTEAPLENGYNVDITDLDPSAINVNHYTGSQASIDCTFSQSSHGWAPVFYENTVTGNTNSAYDGFGFPKSIEAGGWPDAPEQYPVGNITSVTNLGTSASCANSIGLNPPFVVTQMQFSTDPLAAKSTTGTVSVPNAGTLTLVTGSPAWMSIVPTNALPVNLVSFAANFTSSGAGAAGLLSVYWDSNVVGTVDESVVGEGVGEYSMSFPVTESNSTHVLSFRLDPFTNVQSTVVITNVLLSQVGVTQPFTLSTTTNTVNGFAVWQLNGEAGFDYGLQASSNLVDWNQVAVLENTNGVVMFYDPDSTNYASRFYRAVAPY